MTERGSSRKPVGTRPSVDLGKSIFPTFEINVPMPSDTAVPGSYKNPGQQQQAHSSSPQKSKSEARETLEVGKTKERP
jgi:hypothetical protein